jgi:hypothetical protein
MLNGRAAGGSGGSEEAGEAEDGRARALVPGRGGDNGQDQGPRGASRTPAGSLGGARQDG